MLAGLVAYQSSDDDDEEHTLSTSTSTHSTTTTSTNNNNNNTNHDQPISRGLVTYDDDGDSDADKSNQTLHHHQQLHDDEERLSPTSKKRRLHSAATTQHGVVMINGHSDTHIVVSSPSSSSSSSSSSLSASSHSTADSMPQPSPSPSPFAASPSSSFTSTMSSSSLQLSVSADSSFNSASPSSSSSSSSCQVPSLQSLLPPLSTNVSLQSAEVMQRFRHYLDMLHEAEAAETDNSSSSTQESKGRRFLSELNGELSFHNPCILQKVAALYDIRAYDSNLPSDVFDAHHFIQLAKKRGDDYRAIEKHEKLEEENRLRNRTAIDFTTGTLMHPNPALSDQPAPSTSQMAAALLAAQNTALRIQNQLHHTHAVTAVPSALASTTLTTTSSTSTTSTNSTRSRASKWDTKPLQTPAIPATIANNPLLAAAFARVQANRLQGK